MLSVAPSMRIFVCSEPVDMRCGRYRLAERVVSQLQQNPLCGEHLYVFFNKRRTSVKVLHFDRCGYAVWHKVLERGTFGIPTKGELPSIDLLCLLEGIDISLSPRKKRFSLSKKRDLSKQM